MTISINNPAARLHNILKRAQGISPQNKINTGNAWALVFGANPSDMGRMLKSMVLLTELIEETRETLEELPGKELHLSSFKNIEKVKPSLNSLHASWATYHKYLTAETLKSLEFSSLALIQLGRTQEIDVDDLQSIRKKIDEVINQIINSSLSEELKKQSVFYLRTLQDALINAEIDGLKSLDHAFHASVAFFFRHREEIKSKESGLYSKISEIVGESEKLASLVANTIAVVEFTTKLLGSG